MLQVKSRNLYRELSVAGHRYVAGLLAYDNAYGISHLAHSESGAVTQSQLLGDIHVVAHRQDTAYRHNPLVGYNHGSVVEGRVLEENVFNKAGIDVGIDNVASLFIIAQRHFPLEDNEGTSLRLRHRHAGIHHLHDMLVVMSVAFIAMAENIAPFAPSALRAEVDQEALDLVLEDYDKDNQTDRHHLIHDGACEPHVEYLGCYDPYDSKEQHAVEQAQRTGALHQAVGVIKQRRYKQYVDKVFNTEVNHVIESFRNCLNLIQ